MAGVRRVEELKFPSDELAAVTARMDQLAAADGWINLVPQLAGGGGPTPPLSFWTLFGGDSSRTTMCTWMHRRDGRGRHWVELGIAHLSGRRAGPQLVEHALPVPTGWVVEQDHPRRGLVLALPATDAHAEVLRWGLRAIEVLAGVPRPFASWRAEIHYPLVND